MSQPRDTILERLRAQRDSAEHELDPTPHELDPTPHELDPTPHEQHDPAPLEHDPVLHEREVETESSNGDGDRALNGRSGEHTHAPAQSTADGTAGATHVAFARVDALSAAIRYPLLVLLPIVILGALGGVLAKRNHVSYSAQAQVLAAAPAPGTSGELPGVVQAEQSLASIYAREIGFNGIVMPMARKLHVTPGYIASHLSATPDPDAPIIKVSATAPDAQQAITMANSSGARLATFVNDQSRSNKPTNSAFGSYSRAANTLERDRAHLNRVSGQNGNSPAAVAAQAQVQEDQLIVQSLGSQYQNAAATTQNTPTLSVFQSATSASSNRGSNLEVYIFGGIVAGLVIGVALATLAANRKTIREARRRVATA